MNENDDYEQSLLTSTKNTTATTTSNDNNQNNNNDDDISSQPDFTTTTKHHNGNSYVKLTSHDSLPSSPSFMPHNQQQQHLLHHRQQPQTTYLSRIKKVLVAGTGFLCDAYDLFVINLVIVILEILYGDYKSSKSVVSTAALWGAVTGQLVFGFLADRIGRRTGFIITLSFIIVGAFGSILSFNISDGFNIFIMLAIWRAILGFGIGGEYPLSATISSETAENVNSRGTQVASVFSMQGVGIILSPIVVITLLRICGPDHLDIVWRLAVGFGGIPGLIMIYFRIRMKETDTFTKQKQNQQERLSKRQVFLYIIRHHWKTLVGTAGGWFIFDITFYANGLFNATIVSILNFDNPATQYDKIVNTVTISIYLALLGLPGYFVGVYLIDRIGRRTLQLLGFFCLGLTYLIMGLTFSMIVKIKWLFIVLYGLTFFFSNAGPNTTTFVLPSESFPTRIRATCHGISAAAGKIGAVVGGAAISPFFSAYGLGNTLIVCSGLALSGLILTWFFVKETMGIEMKEDIEMIEMSDDTSLPGTENDMDKSYSDGDLSSQSLANSLDSTHSASNQQYHNHRNSQSLLQSSSSTTSTVMNV